MTDVTLSERASGFTATFEDTGAFGITFESDGAAILPGEGDIFTLTVTVAETAPPTEFIDVVPTSIELLDQNASELSAFGSSGTFVVGQFCDLNVDGDVNILDIIILIDIALGRTDELTRYQPRNIRQRQCALGIRFSDHPVGTSLCGHQTIGYRHCRRRGQSQRQALTLIRVAFPSRYLPQPQ